VKLVKQKQIDEKELITKAQQGDREAYEKIIAMFTPYIKHIARKYFLLDADIEDLMQIGFLALCDAINKYDINSKANFKTFLYLCVQGDIKNAITKSHNIKNRTLNESLSLEFGDDEEDSWAVVLVGSGQTPEEEVITKQKVQKILTRLKQNLDAQEKSIISFYLQGYRYTEIAEKLKITTKQVDNTLSKAKRVLNKFKKEEDL
jgi:RNA polymerase sporulation-specific sigma factor